MPLCKLRRPGPRLRGTASSQTFRIKPLRRCWLGSPASRSRIELRERHHRGAIGPAAQCRSGTFHRPPARCQAGMINRYFLRVIAPAHHDALDIDTPGLAAILEPWPPVLSGGAARRDQAHLGRIRRQNELIKSRFGNEWAEFPAVGHEMQIGIGRHLKLRRCQPETCRALRQAFPHWAHAGLVIDEWRAGCRLARRKILRVRQVGMQNEWFVRIEEEAAVARVECTFRQARPSVTQMAWLSSSGRPGNTSTVLSRGRPDGWSCR